MILSTLDTKNFKKQIIFYLIAITGCILFSTIGVLEIYGTTNIKVYVYLIVGILLILISIFFNYMKNVLSWRHN